MPTKSARALWQGDFKTGQGTIAPGSGAFEASYSRPSIFGDAGGTSPIEILGASLAGCFAGALVAFLTRAGYEPERVCADAEVHVEPPEKGYFISGVVLNVEARVPGIEPAAFTEIVERAKNGCPVAQALGGIAITTDARLV